MLQRRGLQPIIKWAGGKERELPLILPKAPREFTNFYDPFVGGGAVFTAFSAERYYINDRSEELMSLYRCIASGDRHFFAWLSAFMAGWSAMLRFSDLHEEVTSSYIAHREDVGAEGALERVALAFLAEHRLALADVLPEVFAWRREDYTQALRVNLSRKLRRMREIERAKGLLSPGDVHRNIETAFMGSLYIYFRCIYNDRALLRSVEGLGSAVFMIMRSYAYSGMFRYSRRGDFNVPYGGMAYNRKLLDGKVEYYKSGALRRRLRATEMYNLDFEEFLRWESPRAEDFVFVDPPYDSEFSTYAQNPFTEADQRRLAAYLTEECRARWMLVIKNTPLVSSLYSGRGLDVSAFDKQYLVSFMNRNDKRAEHLVVRNYSD